MSNICQMSAVKCPCTSPARNPFRSLPSTALEAGSSLCSAAFFAQLFPMQVVNKQCPNGALAASFCCKLIYFAQRRVSLVEATRAAEARESVITAAGSNIDCYGGRTADRGQSLLNMFDKRWAFYFALPLVFVYRCWGSVTAVGRSSTS